MFGGPAPSLLSRFCQASASGSTSYWEIQGLTSQAAVRRAIGSSLFMFRFRSRFRSRSRSQQCRRQAGGGRGSGCSMSSSHFTWPAAGGSCMLVRVRAAALLSVSASSEWASHKGQASSPSALLRVQTAIMSSAATARFLWPTGAALGSRGVLAR